MKFNTENTNKKRQHQCMGFLKKLIEIMRFLISVRRLKSAYRKKHKAAFVESCKGLNPLGMK